MADNVIPFPIVCRQPEPAHAAAASDGHAPVTREEMIQLVLRYAYGTRWAQEPRTNAAAEADSTPDGRTT